MRGFTLLELVIVISIFSLIAVLGTAPFLFLKKTNALGNALEESVSLLLSARGKTLSSKDASQYGVHFWSGGAALFPGASFVENNPKNETVLFSAPVEISLISLNGGGNNVVFQRLTGGTDQYGTVTFRLKSDATKTKTLRIEKTGVVSHKI